MSKHGCDECGKWHDGRVGCEMTDQPLSSTLEDSRFNRFDDELIDTYFNEAGKQAIRDYIANQVEANTPTSTDDERDKETAARIREINLLLIDGKCTPEYAYERIEEIVKKQLNANQPQTDEVKPTPVGEFNYRPAVSVRSANQPQTELQTKTPDSSSEACKAILTQELWEYYISLPKVKPSKKGRFMSIQTGEVVEFILAHQEQAVREARIDEWDFIHEALHAANQTAIELATETMRDRIAELTSKESE